MKRNLFAGMLAAAVCAGALPVFAGDEVLCLDCHEPAEDWEGLSREDVLAKARDVSLANSNFRQPLVAGTGRGNASSTGSR